MRHHGRTAAGLHDVPQEVLCRAWVYLSDLHLLAVLCALELTSRQLHRAVQPHWRLVCKRFRLGTASPEKRLASLSDLGVYKRELRRLWGDQHGWADSQNTKHVRCSILRGGGECITTMAYGGWPPRLIVGDYSGSVRCWDLKEWRLAGRELRKLCPQDEHEAFVTAVLIDPLGDRIFTASEDGTIVTCRLSTGEFLVTSCGHLAPVRVISLTDASGCLVSGSDDRTCRLWGPKGEVLDILHGHRSRIAGLKFIPDDDDDDDGDNDGEAGTRTPGRKICSHRRRRNSTGGGLFAMLAEEGKAMKRKSHMLSGILLTAERFGVLRVWRIRHRLSHRHNDRDLRRPRFAMAAAAAAAAESSDDYISENLLSVAVGCGTEGFFFAENYLLAWSGNGKVVVADHIAIVEDCRRRSRREADEKKTGSPVVARVAPHPPSLLPALARSASCPDLLGRSAVAGSTRDLLRRIKCSREAGSGSDADEAAALAHVEFLVGHQGPVCCVCATRASVEPIGGKAVETLVAVSGDERGEVRMWDVVARRPLRSLHGHTSSVRSCTVNATVAVTGGCDTSVRVWATRNGDALRTLTGHTAVITGVACAGPAVVISCSNDKTVRVWDAREAKAHFRRIAPAASGNARGNENASGAGDGGGRKVAVVVRPLLPPAVDDWAAAQAVARDFSPDDGDDFLTFERALEEARMATVLEMAAQHQQHVRTAASSSRFLIQSGPITTGLEASSLDGPEATTAADGIVGKWNAAAHGDRALLCMRAVCRTAIPDDPDATGGDLRAICGFSNGDVSYLSKGGESPLGRHADAVVAVDAVGSMAASASLEGTVSVFGGGSRLYQTTLSPTSEETPQSCLLLTTMGDRSSATAAIAVVSGWSAGSIAIDDFAQGRQTLVVDGIGCVNAPPRLVATGEAAATSPAMCLEQSPLHNKNVVCGYGDGHLRTWDMRSGRCQSKFCGKHEGPVLGLCVPRGGAETYVCSVGGGTVLVWDLRKHGAVNSLTTGGRSAPCACAYDSARGSLLLGTIDGGVFEWELRL